MNHVHGAPTPGRLEWLADALEWSAHDPDGEHPAWVTHALRGANTPGWIDGDQGDQAVKPAAPKPQQVELDLFSATPMEPEPTPEEALADALAALQEAHDVKGELPTLDDCHRRRYGLPGVEAFNRAGGWHQVLVRYRATLEGAA